MARDLKLQVLLQAVDRATRPIKAISQGSVGLARTLKQSRDTLKTLQAQQKDVGSFRTLRAAAEQTGAAMADNRDRVRQLSRELASTANPTRELTRDFKRAVREAQALKQKHAEQQRALQGLRNQLGAAGISTRNLGQHERELRQRIQQTNQSISEQGRRMERLSQQQRRLHKARGDFNRAQQVAGGMAASGAAGIATAYGLSRPLAGVVQAFAPAEDARTQLKASMMGRDGSVGEDFERIANLATRLGDRLPGTTADFQEMMTMLRRQGISATSILGGTGGAAAYLGVQLQMPVTEAAEFAAKMQDATRTVEADMMGLMDTIQRGFYLGVDSNNMLQGFTKLSPVMSVIKKEGLAAANTLAPFLVMMDQTGMAGESAGNAIRKVFQSGLNPKRFTKANNLLNDLKVGFNLDFTDGRGSFGGIDNLFKQLEKLKRLNDVDRTSVMATMFGDDAETLQVVNTLMAKGMAGYQEVAAKMQAQADLRQRVNEQLGTLTNTLEAAQGSWTNAMAEFGEAIAPQLKALLGWLGEVANSVGAWARENPRLAAGIVAVLAVIAALAAVFGVITIAIASLLGPFAMLRLGMVTFGVATNAALWPILLIIAAVAALAAAAYLIYRNWEPIKTFFAGLWADVKAAFLGAWDWLSGLPARFADLGGRIIGGLVGGISSALGRVKAAVTGAGASAIGWFKETLGIHSPSRVFAELGGYTMEGLSRGIVAGRQGPLAAMAGIGRQLAGAGAITLGAGGALAVDHRPPLAPASGGVVVQGDTVQITIEAGAGVDVAALARQIHRILDERERGKAARVRSALFDRD